MHLRGVVGPVGLRTIKIFEDQTLPGDLFQAKRKFYTSLGLLLWTTMIQILIFYDLCLWFRASLICINNCPMRCNTKRSIYYSASLIYMFRVSTTPIIRSTQNCNYSLRYWSYFLCSYLPPMWPTWSRWREVAAQHNMTSTGGCSYSFVN